MNKKMHTKLVQWTLSLSTHEDDDGGAVVTASCDMKRLKFK